MADIFEEVEEGLRQDRAERLWKKYGVFAYIAAALLIGGVAANEYLQHRTTQSAEQNAQAFETARNALADQEFQSAAEGFEALADSDARIAPLAANFLAEARLQGNADRAAAIAALEQAAAQDTPIGKLSRLKAAYLKSETASRQDVEAYLGSLANEDTQFGALALELLASMAVAEGDFDYAREQFGFLRLDSPYVPQGVRQRAIRALAALPAAAPATQPAEGQPETTADGGEGQAPATDGDQQE
ncbi:tetratricopeptide repeat protein [Henriciella mobilis]|uniref:tetratricopeptide repeat protein n=1 Tax=Henriciella mobilis TaxID=2305467 RepID=UPI001313DF6F|nr:tetratricopeptide repeat protein [Henriciella mobilis]